MVDRHDVLIYLYVNFFDGFERFLLWAGAARASLPKQSQWPRQAKVVGTMLSCPWRSGREGDQWLFLQFVAGEVWLQPLVRLKASQGCAEEAKSGRTSDLEEATESQEQSQLGPGMLKEAGLSCGLESLRNRWRKICPWHTGSEDAEAWLRAGPGQARAGDWKDKGNTTA